MELKESMLNLRKDEIRLVQSKTFLFLKRLTQGNLSQLPLKSYKQSKENSTKNQECLNAVSKECEKVKKEIDDGVRNAAYKIIDGKGATFYGIAGALCRICRAITNNEYAILTVSSHQDNVEGVKNVCLSLPTVLGKRGVHQVIYPALDEQERKALHDSALVMKEYSDKALEMIAK